jgi:hypothetical protein
MALAWARKHCAGGQLCVVEATIQLQNCLDLFDLPAKELYASRYDALYQELGRETFEKLNQTTTGAYRIDCCVFNLLCDELEEDGQPVDVIRSPFAEGPRIWEDSQRKLAPSGGGRLDHVQLCVRNCAAIIGNPRLLYLSK